MGGVARLQGKVDHATFLYFPATEVNLSSVVGLALAGDGLFGGAVKPSWVPAAKWVELPFIYDPSFETALLEIVENHQISDIISRHPASILKLRATKELERDGVKLISWHPDEVVGVLTERAIQIHKEVSEFSVWVYTKDPWPL